MGVGDSGEAQGNHGDTVSDSLRRIRYQYICIQLSYSKNCKFRTSMLTAEMQSTQDKSMEIIAMNRT